MKQPKLKAGDLVLLDGTNVFELCIVRLNTAGLCYLNLEGGIECAYDRRDLTIHMIQKGAFS